MSNKIMFGLEKVHIAFKSEEGYETPIHVPGAVNLGLTPEGDTNTFYADNIAYFSMTSNNGYTGDLEMALVPDTVLAEMLGWEIDGNGMLVEIADGIQKEFALLFEVKGNEKNKRYVYYNCKASRPAEEHQTKKESIEPNTQALTLAIMPIDIEGKNIVKGGLELSTANADVYNSWYDGVIVPDGSPNSVDKTKLATVIALAGTLTELTYTVASWDILDTAVIAAGVVNQNVNATQQEVNNAIKNVNAGILQLEVA